MGREIGLVGVGGLGVLDYAVRLASSVKVDGNAYLLDCRAFLDEVCDRVVDMVLYFRRGLFDKILIHVAIFGGVTAFREGRVVGWGPSRARCRRSGRVGRERQG